MSNIHEMKDCKRSAINKYKFLRKLKNWKLYVGLLVFISSIVMFSWR